MAMPTKTQDEFFCVLCIARKNTDIDTCIECSQTFCIEHINEHKQILGHNFISKVRVCTKLNDIFEIFIGDIQIADDGQLVVHGLSVSHACVRGRSQYNSGQHRVRFRIDSYNINNWIFFGIISHDAIMRSNTWAIPTSYGWGGQDSVILNCAMYAGFNGYYCDFQLHDIIELLLDCDHAIISIKNQRTNSTYKIDIDLHKCPFPWHFHLNLFYPNDQVRILSVES